MAVEIESGSSGAAIRAGARLLEEICGDAGAGIDERPPGGHQLERLGGERCRGENGQITQLGEQDVGAAVVIEDLVAAQVAREHQVIDTRLPDLLLDIHSLRAVADHPELHVGKPGGDFDQGRDPLVVTECARVGHHERLGLRGRIGEGRRPGEYRGGYTVRCVQDALRAHAELFDGAPDAGVRHRDEGRPASIR